MKRKTMGLIIFFGVLSVCGVLPASAKTIFVGPSEAYKTIKAGIAAMNGGDTLIIRDGTYTGSSNMICNGKDSALTTIKNGSPAAYTTIKAENYLGAVIDAAGSNMQPLYISGNSYVRFENLHFRNSEFNANCMIQNSDHIKFIKCASEESQGGHFYFTHSKYCLVEDSFAWGRVSYAFWNGGEYGDYTQGQYIIFRRCVVRKDAHAYVGSASQTNWYGSFVTYRGDNTYFQNCISIDGEFHRGGPTQADPGSEHSVFFLANGGSNFRANGTLSINDDDYSLLLPEGSADTVYLNNVVMIRPGANGQRGLMSYPNGIKSYQNCIIAGNQITADAGGNGVWAHSNGGIKNNIIYNNRVGLYEISSGTNAYNVLYNYTNYANGTKSGDRRGYKQGPK